MDGLPAGQPPPTAPQRPLPLHNRVIRAQPEASRDEFAPYCFVTQIGLDQATLPSTCSTRT